MKLILHVTAGPDAPRSFILEPGEEVRVGRMAPAKIILSNDRSVSRLHFSLQCDGKSWRLRDLGSSHGTTVNGQPVTGALLTDGDQIVAGTTSMQVHFGEDQSTVDIPGMGEGGWPEELPPTEYGAVETGERDVMGPEPGPPSRVLGLLQSQKHPLYAILDAARDPMVFMRIQECTEKKQSLYEGPQAERLAFVAPYLVSLPKGSPVLETLVREGWGNSWGVYLTCDQSFEAVRRHLRHFLMVELEGKKEKVLFRFYDPRVLRTYLPTCTPEEIAEFLGPIKTFVTEDGDPGIALRFDYEPPVLKQRIISLALSPAMG